jgi:hypothetical protein
MANRVLVMAAAEAWSAPEEICRPSFLPNRGRLGFMPFAA